MGIYFEQFHAAIYGIAIDPKILQMLDWREEHLMDQAVFLPLSYIMVNMSHHLFINTVMFDTYHISKSIHIAQLHPIPNKGLILSAHLGLT